MNNKNIQAQYRSIKNEIEEFIKEFQSNSDVSEKINEYYKGVQVFFSPLIHNPKILFIGINPGAGYYNWKKQPVKRLSPLVNNEYYYSDYRLAKQTQKLFEISGIGKEELKESVKINCFFFATKNEKELYQLLSHLRDNGVYSKSYKWARQIVELINPEVIICEGKSAFDHFVKLCEVENISDANNVLLAEYGKIKVLGYKRKFSNISNLVDVAEQLKRLNSETMTKR